MAGQADPRRDALALRDASLETLIDWLRQERLEKPRTPLRDLLGGQRVELTRLIDLACVDLIEQHRSGHTIGAESYVDQFPELGRNELLLDLIDAEICVARELQQPVDPRQYAKRFPALVDEINELLIMQQSPSIAGAFQPLPENDSSDLPSTTVEFLGDHPVDGPDWFSPEKCFASGPGRWLIRGRDRSCGEVMAMKVLALPSLSTEQSRHLLDACEAASKVRHCVFVPPTLAAIERGHLGVIRPWVFGIPWIEVAAKGDVATQLRQFASLAYCLEAVRRSGAAHGGLHHENLFIDHDGNVRLVDAAGSRSGVRRWLESDQASEPAGPIVPLAQRQRQDLDDLIRLVESASESWREPWTSRLLKEMKRIAEGSHNECGADELGALLMRYADQPPRGNLFQRWSR
jgi:hypothetical protein